MLDSFDQLAVERQQLRLRQRPLVRERYADQDVALPLGIGQGSTPPRLGVTGGKAQPGSAIEQADDLDVESVDLSTERLQIARLEQLTVLAVGHSSLPQDSRGR